MPTMPGRERKKKITKRKITGKGRVPYSGPKKPEGAGLGFSLFPPTPQPLAELQEERLMGGSRLQGRAGEHCLRFGPTNDCIFLRLHHLLSSLLSATFSEEEKGAGQ